MTHVFVHSLDPAPPAGKSHAQLLADTLKAEVALLRDRARVSGVLDQARFDELTAAQRQAEIVVEQEHAAWRKP